VNLNRTLRWVAFGWAALFTALAGAFTAGYALDDPGGWRGVGLVAAWLVPLALLTAAAIRWPRKVVGPLAIAAGLTVMAEAAALVAHRVWADFENGVGPVRAVVVFTLAAPLAVLALHRIVAAAWLLSGLGLATLLLSMPPGAGSAPMRVVGFCVLVSGLLYVLSNRFRRGDRIHHPQPRQPSAVGRP
jgi:hypothetical protein